MACNIGKNNAEGAIPLTIVINDLESLLNILETVDEN